jgi:hypothetical protein
MSNQQIQAKIHHPAIIAAEAQLKSARERVIATLGKPSYG